MTLLEQRIQNQKNDVQRLATELAQARAYLDGLTEGKDLVEKEIRLAENLKSINAVKTNASDQKL